MKFNPIILIALFIITGCASNKKQQHIYRYTKKRVDVTKKLEKPTVISLANCKKYFYGKMQVAANKKSSVKTAFNAIKQAARAVKYINKHHVGAWQDAKEPMRQLLIAVGYYTLSIEAKNITEFNQQIAAGQKACNSKNHWLNETFSQVAERLSSEFKRLSGVPNALNTLRTQVSSEADTHRMHLPGLLSSPTLQKQHIIKANTLLKDVLKRIRKGGKAAHNIANLHPKKLVGEKFKASLFLKYKSDFASCYRLVKTLLKLLYTNPRVIVLMSTSEKDTLKRLVDCMKKARNITQLKKLVDVAISECKSYEAFKERLIQIKKICELIIAAKNNGANEQQKVTILELVKILKSLRKAQITNSILWPVFKILENEAKILWLSTKDV